MPEVMHSINRKVLGPWAVSSKSSTVPMLSWNPQQSEELEDGSCGVLLGEYT